MSLQWYTPRAGNLASESSDGYYSVGLPQRDGMHPAYHKSAAFAVPKLLGHGDSLAQAQKICEGHAASAALTN